MRILKVGLLAVILLLVAGPLISQFDQRDARSFDAVALDETDYREVTFQNPAQSLRLGGMLFLPDGEGPFPAVAMIHGSGSSRRNNGWYLTLARHLQRTGVLVLLPDRGTEKN